MLGCYGEFGCFTISGSRMMNDGIGVEKMKVADVGVEAVVGLVRGGRGSDVMAVLYF
ncbi:hypothetical protein DEO72_LG6g664 [Vigna unguiculata]|uniref:Uncharacterized protein n=1 Tax=Vigna unguiculata TaxID=3917 RepID=A0A4D6M747_VIGUN|nr:hypothetical protein DEO72_LG6g664 [Vigna unguiculata]